MYQSPVALGTVRSLITLSPKPNSATAIVLRPTMTLTNFDQLAMCGLV